MKEFKNAPYLQQAFLDGEIRFDESIKVDGEIFKPHSSSRTTIAESLSGKRPMFLYKSEQSNAEYVFVWEAHTNGIVAPKEIIKAEHGIPKNSVDDLVVEMNGEKITIRPDQLIGDIAMIKFTSLQSPKELQGKTDTGATISSLHAEHYKINGNTVTFTCPPLGPNSVTVPLKTQHAVKSPDGGTVYRPVISLNVKVNGKLLNNIEFNLNDRGNMDQPVLIGQNLLQAGKFYVDPSRNEGLTVEDYDWVEVDNILAEQVKEKDPQVIAELYQKMLESNINFGDLVRHIKSEITKTDLEY